MADSTSGLVDGAGTCSVKLPPFRLIHSVEATKLVVGSSVQLIANGECLHSITVGFTGNVKFNFPEPLDVSNVENLILSFKTMRTMSEYTVEGVFKE